MLVVANLRQIHFEFFTRNWCDAWIEQIAKNWTQNMLWCSTSFKKIVENDEDCKIDYQIDHLLLISQNVFFRRFNFIVKRWSVSLMIFPLRKSIANFWNRSNASPSIWLLMNCIPWSRLSDELLELVETLMNCVWCLFKISVTFRSKHFSGRQKLHAWIVSPWILFNS